MTGKRQKRRGVAGVLAMLYLVLFSTLALGFYAAVTASIQVAKNDRDGTAAQIAAESGMQFIRYQLSALDIPGNTAPDQVFTQVHTQLVVLMQGTGNLGGGALGYDGSTITVPSDNYITLDSSGSKFRAVIEAIGQQLRVRVTGVGGSGQLSRQVQLDYAVAQRASAVFGFGVASNGKITTSGSSKIEGSPDPARGSLLSTCMTDPTPIVIGGKVVSGDISITNPAGNISVSGASVGGTTNPDQMAAHLHKGVEAPEFPVVDTDAFKPFALTKYTGGKDLTNCYIPANTNPKFTGGCNIKGVLYVQTPNTITFRGNTVVQGVIVVQDNPTGDLNSNVLDFSGNVSATGVETLPASFGSLRSLTGAFILAPKFTVSFSGSFGTVNGSIIAGNINFSGNAGGTVKGSVINMENVPMSVNGSSDIIIGSTGTTNYPAGVYFGSHYVPLPDTYAEVRP